MTAAGQLGLDLAAADPGPLRPVDDTYVSDLADALDRGRGKRPAPAPATTARTCRCDPPAVFANEDGPTCAKCGRAP